MSSVIIVCLMGMSNSGKSTIEKSLEKMGYKRSISYTTREPKVRNGKLEENGNEYYFVSREKFMELINTNKLIEYEEIHGNYYGTPKIIGSKFNVAVVCIGGYRAFKEKYGDQVIGIYIKCSDDVLKNRMMTRESNISYILDRIHREKEITNDMEREANIIINGDKSEKDVILDVVKGIKEYRLKNNLD